MNKILALLMCAASAAHALDATAWQWQQPFNVSATGITRLELPAETLNVSRPELEDVRLLSPSGGEVPYMIDRLRLNPPREAAVTAFKQSLADQSTVIEIDTGSTDAIEALRLDCASGNFIKPARLEASNDGTEWHELAANEVLFRQPGGASRLRIPFSSASWRKLRITVDDKRSQPVPFTSARVEFTTQHAAIVPQTATLLQTDEKPHETRLTVNLGAANLHLATLKLVAADPVFNRRVRIAYTYDDNGTSKESVVVSAVIYRVTTDGLSTASLDVPINRKVPASRLVVTIENGDSPPLHVTGIEVARYPVALVFFAQETGSWQLHTGNVHATAPSYDVGGLQRDLAHAAKATFASVAPVSNADYKPPTALPGITPEGAELDVAKWSHRKAIATQGTGAFHIELDTEVLAHSQTSLGDLRVIQNGRQLPFILDRTGRTKAIHPGVAVEADPKRRNVSLWRVTLPLDGLPVARLTASSPTVLFDRSINAWHKRKDSLGNEFRVALGSTQWARNAAKADLNLPINAARLPETFMIETDNGDNPPVAIENVQVHYPVVVLVTKLTDPAPAFLYYGNDRADEPRYDLRMVRQELLSASKQDASLAKEEALRPDKKRATEPAAGSPWLWAAFAVVIGGLLWVVAKMLPAPQK